MPKDTTNCKCFILIFFFARMKFLLGHLGIFLTSSRRDGASHITRERDLAAAARVRSLNRPSRDSVYVCIRHGFTHTHTHTHRRFLGEGDRGRSSKVIPFSLAVRSLRPKTLRISSVYFCYIRGMMKKYAVALLHIKYALFSLIWIR